MKMAEIETRLVDAVGRANYAAPAQPRWRKRKSADALDFYMILGHKGFNLRHYEVMGGPAESDVQEHRVGSGAAPRSAPYAKAPIAARRQKKQRANDEN